MNDLVVVFGGSGFVGKQVVRALAKAGKRVRVAMRRPHLGAELRVMGDVGQIQLMQANVRYPDSVARALEGADAVVNLVGVLHENGKQNFEALHIEAARTIAEAAAKQGIVGLVHMSALGATPKGPRYGRSKYNGERAVLSACADATILRPSLVFGPEDDFFNRFANAAKFSPVLFYTGAKAKFQPIFVGDVADAVVAALNRVEARGRVYELGGPNIYTLRQLLHFTTKEAGRARPLIDLPFVIAFPMGLLADWLFKLIPFADPPITGDQVTMLQRDNIVGAEAGAGTIQDLGVTDLASIEAIVPTYLWRFRPYGQFQTKQNPA
ncbi:MAG: complex I NDUFA9 subunit family protein [Terricaulis sp.]